MFSVVIGDEMNEVLEWQSEGVFDQFSLSCIPSPFCYSEGLAACVYKSPSVFFVSCICSVIPILCTFTVVLSYCCLPFNLLHSMPSLGLKLTAFPFHYKRATKYLSFLNPQTPQVFLSHMKSSIILH